MRLDPFQVAASQITWEQWSAVMGGTPSEAGTSNLPAVDLSWHSARAFARKLNVAGDGWNYRLPTEAELEYLSNRPLAKPGPWEWALDFYAADYYTGSSPAVNPTGPRSTGYVTVRHLSRPTYRLPYPPNFRELWLGFRVVRTRKGEPTSSQPEEPDVGNQDEAPPSAQGHLSPLEWNDELLRQRAAQLRTELKGMRADSARPVAVGPVGIEFVTIPPGKYEASKGGCSSEREKRLIVITKPFQMTRVPMTKKQWSALVPGIKNRYRGTAGLRTVSHGTMLRTFWLC